MVGTGTVIKFKVKRLIREYRQVSHFRLLRLTTDWLMFCTYLKKTGTLVLIGFCKRDGVSTARYELGLKIKGYVFDPGLSTRRPWIDPRRIRKRFVDITAL